METAEFDCDIPENVDNIVFAENFVSCFMSTFGFNLPFTRIPAEHRDLLYNPFNEMVKVAAQLVYKRISVFNSFATFEKLTIVDEYSYLLLYTILEKRYFSEDFRFSRFLYYCSQLTYMAISFYIKGVYEAPSLAVQAIIDKLDDCNLQACGGWQALNKVASVILCLALESDLVKKRSLGNLNLLWNVAQTPNRNVNNFNSDSMPSPSNEQTLKRSRNEKKEGKSGKANECKAGLSAINSAERCDGSVEHVRDSIIFAKEHGGESIDSNKSEMAISAANSHKKYSINGTEQTMVGNVHFVTDNGAAVKPSESERKLPIVNLDESTHAVDKASYFTKDDESVRSTEKKTVMPTVNSDENCLFDGYVDSENCANEIDELEHSNESKTRLTANFDEVGLDDKNLIVNENSTDDESLQSIESKTSISTTSSDEKCSFDGLMQTMMENVNFIEEDEMSIIDFIYREDVLNATYDW